MPTLPRNRLSPTVQKAFKAWIGHDTWHTGHPLDEERFYRFVWTVQRYSRRPLSESALRELIVSEWSARLDESFLAEQALHYSGLIATLLEFAKVRN